MVLFQLLHLGILMPWYWCQVLKCSGAVIIHLHCALCFSVGVGVVQWLDSLLLPLSVLTPPVGTSDGRTRRKGFFVFFFH